MPREIVCRGLGMQLELDSTQLRILEDKCEQRGAMMPPSYKKLAMIPRGATVFPNTIGMTPGFAMVKGHQSVIMLPGTPGEYLPMLIHEVFPFLARRSQAQVASRTIALMNLGWGRRSQTIGGTGRPPEPSSLRL